MHHVTAFLHALFLRAALALCAVVLLPLCASEATPVPAKPVTPSPAPAAPIATKPKPAAPAAPVHTPWVRPSPEIALEMLLEGNARFATGRAEHPRQTAERRTEVAGGQTPFAVILTCSDSQVPPELYFDQGLGDLFVIRDAGNTLNDHVIGSIEYAVEHLHASIVVVVGHEKCGVVAAAVAGHAEGRISTIVAAIRPAVRETRNQAGDKTDNAIRGNARRAAQTLTVTAPIISQAVQTGQIKIFAARYDLDTGRIELLP